MSTFGSEALPGNVAGYYALGLAALIPGYLGYGKRETRQNADRELRRYILGRMQGLRAMLAEASAAGADREAAVEALRRTDELEKSIEEAGTGLQSFFAAGDLSETDVDEIHAYDRKIIDHLDAMEKAGPTGDAQVWSEHLDQLASLVEERGRAIGRVAA